LLEYCKLEISQVIITNYIKCHRNMYHTISEKV
jgi:hypothetical protein